MGEWGEKCGPAQRGKKIEAMQTGVAHNPKQKAPRRRTQGIQTDAARG